MLVLDILYLGLMFAQRFINKQAPSNRFDGYRVFIFVHVICGLVIISVGSVIHVLSEKWT